MTVASSLLHRFEEAFSGESGASTRTKAYINTFNIITEHRTMKKRFCHRDMFTLNLIETSQ